MNTIVKSAIWQMFIWILWIFAIRIQEAKFVMPGNVRFDTRTNQWVVTLKVPKMKDQWETQTVWIPEHTIPAEVVNLIAAFAALTNWKGWENSGIRLKRVAAHLKKEVPSTKKVWTHSFRHGRLRELRKRFGYTPDQVITCSRHASVKALNTYAQG